MRTGLFFLLIAVTTHVGFASYEDSSSYGFVGGVSMFNSYITKPSGADGDPTSNSFGPFVGVYGERNLSQTLVLTPGIYFSQKGAKNNFASRQANYLETSAMLRWYFINQSSWRSYFGVGGGFGILLSAEDNDNNGGSVDFRSRFSKNELSFQGGWGLEFPVGNDTGMQIGITYSRGLTSYLDPSAVGGDRGLWSGFYSFLALRFKTREESNSAEDRARDYLKLKNGEMSSSDGGE